MCRAKVVAHFLRFTLLSSFLLDIKTLLIDQVGVDAINIIHVSLPLSFTLSLSLSAQLIDLMWTFIVTVMNATHRWGYTV